jgi:hypothetical protein
MQKESRYNISMTNERKDLLNEKIKAVFDAIDELSGVLEVEDVEWADQFDSDDKDATEEDEHLALSILNLSQDVKDMANDLDLQ